MNKFERIGYVIVVALFMAAVAVLLPWNSQVRQEAWETVYHKYDFPVVTKQEALAKIRAASDQTMAQLPDIDADTAYENFKLVNTFGALNRQKRYEELRNDPAVSSAVHSLAQLNVNTIDSLQQNRLRVRDEVGRRRAVDPLFLALDKPEESVWHWDVLIDNASSHLMATLAFIGLAFIGLLQLWGWAKLVNVTVSTVSLALSLSGNAFAQVKKAEVEKKKQKTENMLQIDAMASFYGSEGPPNPNLFLRVTNYTRKTGVESISVYNPRSHNWYTEVAGGWWIPGFGKTQVLGMGVVSGTRNAHSTAGLGIQVYRGGKFGLLAIPELRWERNINGPPRNAFAFIANPNIKMGLSKWSIAPQLSLRRTQTRPWSWTIGAALRLTVDKGRHQYEQGTLTNNLGWLWQRSRAISTWAY